MIDDIVCIGDWGWSTPIRERVMERLREFGGSPSAAHRLILLLGDNFYPHGVMHTRDPRWQEDYEKNVGFYVRCKVLALLGNHDYMGSIEAQISYSWWSSTWHMPHPYYIYSLTPFVTVVMMDTCILAPLQTLQLTQLAVVESYEWAARQQLHFDWLKATLQRLRQEEKFIIVCGHYPLFSGGPHGDSPELVDRLLPIFKQYGVCVYISGHEHNIQHIFRDGVHCLISGTGCEATPCPTFSHGTLFQSASPGYLHLHIRNGQTRYASLDVSFVSTQTDHKLLYHHHIVSN